MTDQAPQDERRRAGDRGLMCTLALRASQLWDFIDKRQIDKHVVSAAILTGTVRIMHWAMAYASAPHAGMSGVDISAVIAAVVAPYAALQGAAINFYFRARSD